jgi:hypothetical protein
MHADRQLLHVVLELRQRIDAAPYLLDDVADQALETKRDWK